MAKDESETNILAVKFRSESHNGEMESQIKPTSGVMRKEQHVNSLLRKNSEDDEESNNDSNVAERQCKSYENIISQQRRYFEAVKKENATLRQKQEELESLNTRIQMELEGEKQFARTIRQQLRDVELKVQFDTFIMEEQKRENEMLKKLLSEEQKRNLIQNDQIRELRNQLQNTHLRIETQINDIQVFLRATNN